MVSSECVDFGILSLDCLRNRATPAPTAMPAPTTAPVATTAPTAMPAPTTAPASNIDCKGAKSGDTLSVVYQWSGNEEQKLQYNYQTACGCLWHQNQRPIHSRCRGAGYHGEEHTARRSILARTLARSSLFR